ncbi:MAG: hypothetical protein HY823_08735 [Acidobacteria bacterium]|nr:hypothetical protein [Acidobacteriota bacterium]
MVEHLGRQALVGSATLKDAMFQDGVIELDMAVTGERSYPGVLFRQVSPGNTERFYLRPHRATAARYPDVVQYLPMFNGVDSWQLYSGDGFTAFAPVPTGQWFHVRLEVKGSQARIFVGDMKSPALEIPHLQREPASGGIGLMAPMDGSAFFSNLSYRKDDTLRFDPPPPVWGAPGIIRDWELSGAVKAALVEDDRPPQAQRLPALAWRPAKVDSQGRLDVSRFLGRQPGGPDTVFVRTTLRADQDEIRRIRFGYSDTATVFLNGKPIYTGDNSYTLRDPSFLGIMGTFDTLFLPLRKGDNELQVTLTESMGGWGLVAQDAKATFAAPGVSKLWKATGFRVPESAAYDSVREVLYVSNFDPYRLGAGQTISRVGLDGKILDRDWVKDLRNPAGLKVHGDTLWVVEPRALVEVDIAAGNIRARHDIPGAQMLNDVEVDASGVVYVSDSRKGCVLRMAGGKPEVFLDGPDFVRPNGLLLQGGRLWVATNGDGTLKAVDITTKAIQKVLPVGKGIGDGLAADEAGNLFMTHNEGRLFRIDPRGTILELLDTTVPGQYLGDITYVPGRRMVVAPTYLDGGLVAYEIPR